MNIQAFFDAPLVVQLHALSALAALSLGAVQLLAPKGALPHRIMGMVWVALMAMVASTAIFIREINDGSFSLIHLFVPLTFFGLFGIVRNAVTGDFKGHLSTVRGLFFGALIIPGLFAFLPGRLMWEIALG